MNRYWVGGTGNWNAADTTHWSASSGGAGGASVPTPSDDVFFDGNSGSGIVNAASSGMNCLNLDFTGYTGSLTNPDINNTLTRINIFGDLIVSASLNIVTNINFSMRATSGTHTMTFNGNTSAIGLHINGPGGTFQLVDDFTGIGFNDSSGTFDPNGRTVRINGVGYLQLDNTTFFNLTITGQVQMTSGNAIVAGTFTMNGPSQTNRYFLKGSRDFTGSSNESNIGTPRTVTAAIVSISNCDFQDIVGAGAGSWTGTSIGDGLGNSGITFTAPTTRYWVGDGGNWDDTAHWATSTGGASGATMPLPQDDVFFDANSITSGGQIITANYRFLGTNVDFTGVLNNPDLRFALSITSVRVTQNIVLGDLILETGMTTSSVSQDNSLTMEARSTSSITTNGVVLDTNFILSTYLSTFNLNDNIILGSSNYVFAFGTGTLNTNNFAITCGLFRSLGTLVGTLTRVINMGSTILTINGTNDTSTLWNLAAIFSLNSSSLTYNQGTSQIIITDTSATLKTFIGAGRTYYDIEFIGDNISVSGMNTFNDFAVNNGGRPTGLVLPSATQTISSFQNNGSAGNFNIISTTTPNATISMASGTVCADYLDLTDIHATGGAQFFAGANSIDNGNNLGWSFISCVSPRTINGQFFTMF